MPSSPIRQDGTGILPTFDGRQDANVCLETDFFLASINWHLDCRQIKWKQGKLRYLGKLFILIPCGLMTDYRSNRLPLCLWLVGT